MTSWALVAVLLAQPAAESSRVLLVKETVSTPFAARATAELRALGFEVDEVVEPSVTPEVLEGLARLRGALAAVAVHRGARRVEVWLVDRVTGKFSARALPTSSPDVMAVKLVELLRASLLEVQVRGFEPAEVAPTPAVREVVVQAVEATPPPAAPAPGPQLHFAALGGALGGLGARPQVVVGALVSASFTDWFGVGLDVAVPVWAAGVTAAEGTVSVAALRLGGEARWLVRGRRDVVLPWLGVGLVADRVGVSAAAAPGFEARGGAAWTVGARGSVGLRLQLASLVALVVAASGAAGWPVPVRVDGREAWSWGPFSWGALVAFEVGPLPGSG